MGDRARVMDGKILRWRGILDRLVASYVAVEVADRDVSRLEAELPDTAKAFQDVEELYSFTKDYSRRTDTLHAARTALKDALKEHSEACGACGFVPEGASLIHPYSSRVYRIQRLKATGSHKPELSEGDGSGPPAAAEGGYRDGSTDAPNFKITLHEAGATEPDGQGGEEDPAEGPGPGGASADTAFGPPEPSIAERLSGTRSGRGPGRRRQRRLSLADDEGQEPSEEQGSGHEGLGPGGSGRRGSKSP